MDSYATLKRLSRSTASGLAPAYSEAHVLKAIEIIGSLSGIGRKMLSKELGLGEGTVRTLVKRLKEEGVLESSRGGMFLTSLGEKLLGDLHESLRATELEETIITVGRFNYAVLVKGLASGIKSGVEQRDTALIAGAKGATTLIFKEGCFHIPSLEIEFPERISQRLIERLSPEEGDVIIIGTADSLLEAELGAKAAALEILEKKE
ncbi:hypothetical protein KEJ21_00030 [Candidatus Bathyarchaeota archaeon]|nr:hypothetical protein [Candidatus Bathyarchaeota archaeon]MBS7630157.1 hypothetical protein [Candidatus Bathyarchaeota archaeon]